MKKGMGLLFAAACCLAMPVLVMASWTLSTRVGSGGGALQVRSDTPQTSASGTIFKTYTTHANVPVTLTATASPSDAISNIQINGTYVTPLPSGSPQVYQMGLQQYPALTSQSVVVWFTPLMDSITANAITAGGTVSPYNTFTRQVGTSQSIVFTPNTGRQVIGITGLPATGYTLSPATLPAPLSTPVTLTFTVPSTPLTIGGIFMGVVAKAGVPQYVWPGSVVTLDGSGSMIYAGGSPLSYSWSWVPSYGQVGTLSGQYSAKPTFTTPYTGTYRFNMAVTNGTYSDTTSTYITVTSDAAATARTSCQNCHQGNGVGVSTNVFGNWSSSRHAADLVMCATCHVGADTGGHPGSLSETTVNATTFKVIWPTNGLATGDYFCTACHNPIIAADFTSSPHNANGLVCTSCHKNGAHNPDGAGAACAGCHLDSTGNVPNHPVQIGTNPCTTCHNPHSTVGAGGKTKPPAPFSNISSAGHGTLKFVLKSTDPATGAASPVLKAYTYLHNAAKPPPMERFFSRADYILAPASAGDGTYTINGAPAGTYYIRLNQRAAAAQQTSDGALGPPEAGDLTWRQTAPVTIVAGQTLDLGTLYAYPFGSASITITGTVTSSSGAPLVGRYVRAQTVPCYNDGYDYNINQCGPVKDLALKPTDGSGRYTLRLRTPGTYYIYTSPCISAQYNQYTGNVCTYTPAAANPVTVNTGDVKTVNIVAY